MVTRHRFLSWLIGVARVGTLLVLVAGLLATSPHEPKPVATVLVFLNTECPVSQQYTRLLADLHRQYRPYHVQFTALYPSPTDSRLVIGVFHQTYALPFSGLPDKGHAYMRQYQAKTTPEVVVLNEGRRVVYQGAIDNQYIALGRRRPAPTQSFLADALAAILDKRPILTARTEAVGCLIE